MKLKTLTLTLVSALFAATSFAQLSTGEPTAKVYRVGNRAEKGNFGLYLGVKTSMFKDIFDGDISVTALPLINLKYMVTDQIEGRLGIEFYQTTEKLKGQTDLGSSLARSGNTDFILYPGVAYHFCRYNILDVYGGVELPIGWSSSSAIADVDMSSKEYDSYSESVTKRSFVVGLGAFVGLQAFVGKLPLAVGLEYGISSQFDMGLKYKHEVTENGKTQTFYTPDGVFENVAISSTENFKNLKAKKGTIGNQLRLTFTYYFK